MPAADRSDVRRRAYISLRPRRSRRRLQRLILAPIFALGVVEFVAGAALICYATALAAADDVLAVRSPSAPADAIVVLGGDGPPRAARAAELYRAGMAPEVVVSGDGDCLFIQEELLRLGVPASAISLECSSRTTWENAERTMPILAAMGVGRAIIVTSWYHSRRALASFRAVEPRVQWSSRPVERARSLWDLASEIDGGKIAKEYPKLIAYTLRYGTNPFFR